MMMDNEKNNSREELSFILEAVANFIDLSFQENIFQYIADKIRQLNKNAIVSVSSFDEKSCSLKVNTVQGLGKFAEAVANLMGGLPTGRSFKIEKDAKQELLRGRLVEIPEGISSLSPDLPKAVWKAIEKILNVKQTYSMGFTWNGKLFGNIVIVLQQDTKLQNKHLVESFVKISSVAFQNKQVQETLDQTYKEIELQVARRTKELVKEVELHTETLQTLREKEEDFRLLADTASEIILTLNFDGTIMYINQRGLEISGYGLDEVIGTNFSAIIPKDKVEYLKELLAKRAEGFSEQLLYETEFINKEGKLLPVEVSSNLISKGDKPFGVLVSARDITERKTAVNELKKSEHRYRTLINTMQEGLVEVDSKWNIMFTNDRFAQIIGYTKEQLIGRSFYDLISKDTLQVAEKQHLLREQGETDLYELELITSDERQIFVLCSPNPSYDENGKYLGGFGIISDITERKVVEKEREKLIAELQKALANVKKLSGLLPICSSCKKIRDDRGYWNQIESYISDHSEADFSHSICRDCAKILYPELDIYDD